MSRLLSHSGKLFRKSTNTNTNDQTRYIYLSFNRYCYFLENDEEVNNSRKKTSKLLTRKILQKYLERKLNCPANVATNIWLSAPVLHDRQLDDIDSIVDLLTAKGVTSEHILDQPLLLSLKEGNLQHRLSILESMKPHKIEDFLPLATIGDKRLVKIRSIAERDVDLIPSRHRIYHYSEMLELKPYTTSKHASTRLYMLELPFEVVDRRLKILLTCKTPAEIVSNLNYISNGDKFLESLRTAKLQKMAKENEKRLSLTECFVKRLDSDIKEVETIMTVYPFLTKMDIKKLEEKLDFLLVELGVKPSLIVYAPRLLKLSVEQLKKRFYQLQSLGYECHGHRQMIVKVSGHQKLFDELIVKLKEQQDQHDQADQQDRHGQKQQDHHDQEDQQDRHDQQKHQSNNFGGKLKNVWKSFF